MKKILKLMSLALVSLLFVGCGNTNLDLTKVKENVENVTTGEFDRITAAYTLSTTEYFDSLIDLYDWDLEELGISVENIKQVDGVYDYSMAMDNEENYVYFIGKAENNDLKKELDKFFDSFEDVMKKEMDGYLVYIASKANSAAYKALEKGSSPKIYNMLTYVEGTDLEAVLGVKEDLVDEYLVATPSFMTSASQYIILKPSEGKKDEVMELMNTYMSNLQEQWDMYLPDQAELVKERTEVTVGDYLVYIISTDNDLVLKTIKNSTK